MATRPERRLRLAPVFGALLLILAACGPLPRPFAPDDKDEAALPSVGESAEVLVLGLEGDAPGAGAGAAGQLAEALRGLGIAAETEAATADRLLAGAVSLGSDDEGHDAVSIAWRITDPGGSVLGSFNQVSQLPAGLWSQGQPAAVGSVMARAAQQAAAMLRRRQQAGPSGSAARPRLVLLPIEGLPGDGTYSLPLALERALMAADYEIGWEVEGDDLLILADLRIEPDEAGMELISVTWWVVRARDGSDLGKVDQARQLPKGSLDGRWGVIAEGIAAGAAEGIISVIQRRWRAAREPRRAPHLARFPLTRHHGTGPLPLPATQ